MSRGSYRYYPVKVSLTKDELRMLNELRDARGTGASASEILRNALEYAMAHRGDLDEYIHARKLEEGQSLFKYWEEPRETRNSRLLQELIGSDGKLRCKLMIKGGGLTAVMIPSDCHVSLQENCLRISCTVRRKNPELISEIRLKARSILSVSIYNERYSQNSKSIPPRFESLAENEYLKIELR